MIDYDKLIFVIFISLTVQLTLYLFIKFLNKKGVRSIYSAEQKIHEGEVPRIGGLLFLSSFLVTHIVIKVNYTSLLLPLFIGSIIIFIFSFYEDLKQTLSPYFRLLVLFIGSFIFIFNSMNCKPICNQHFFEAFNPLII